MKRGEPSELKRGNGVVAKCTKNVAGLEAAGDQNFQLHVGPLQHFRKHLEDPVCPRQSERPSSPPIITRWGTESGQ